MACGKRCRAANPEHKCKCSCNGANHGIEFVIIQKQIEKIGDKING